MPEIERCDGDYDLSAIVVNFNGGEMLSRCLEALRLACGRLKVETIVVDNGSTDGSAGSPDVQATAKVISLYHNRGFAEANNIGISHARGRHYLLLNSDCFLRAGSLEAMIYRLESDPHAALVGPRLLNADGTLQPSCHNFPSPAVFFLEQTMLWRVVRLVPGLRNKLLIAGSHESPMKVDWLLGACMLIRREALAESGGFDKKYFFYWEDADLCLRLQKLGWEVRFEPSAEAVHLGGASSSNPLLLVEFFRSLKRFYRKHFTARQLAALIAMQRTMAILKAAPLAIAQLTPRGRSEPTRAVLRQQLHAWLLVAGL